MYSVLTLIILIIKQYTRLLILTIMFLTSYFDDREVMKQESSPPSLVKKTRLIVTSVYSLLSIY